MVKKPPDRLREVCTESAMISSGFESPAVYASALPGATVAAVAIILLLYMAFFK
jgi:hypothetical protein